jgi:DeoD family purine-nucleoside phosphorylase
MVSALPPPAVIHMNPASELADRVLLPGDPHRAMAMAQSLLEGPRMFNHNRGLWGYTGTAPDGRPLTVQSTGMGGPSVAIVVEELLDLGATTLVRVGTCGAFAEGIELGDLVVASAALSADGASAALGATGPVMADRTVTESLLDAGRRHGARSAMVATTDLFYDDRADVAREWIAGGAAAVEMEAATVFRIAERRRVAAGCVLAVTDVLPGGDARAGRVRMDRSAIQDAGLLAGAVAVEALTGVRQEVGKPAVEQGDAPST